VRADRIPTGTAFVLSGATWLHENLTETKIVKAEKKTGACSQFSEAYPIFYKNNKNSQKNGKIWINKVSVWY
jgi:hypothetical protein